MVDKLALVKKDFKESNSKMELGNLNMSSSKEKANFQ